MDSVKRVLRPRQPKNQIKKIQKRNVVKAKKAELMMEQKKVPLKTIFKKVKSGDDGSHDIYMIKGVNETERVTSDVTTDTTEQNSAEFTSNAAANSPQIPDFVTEEIATLINCSDFSTFFNFALDNNAPDEALALLNLYSSASVRNTLTPTDNSAKSANALHSPLDRSTEENRTQNSTLNSVPTNQISNNEPLPSSMAAITTPTICLTPNQCEIPVEHFTTTSGQDVWMADNEFMSTTSCSSTRFDEIRSNEIFGERFIYAKRTIPPVKVLEEILGPRQLVPLYRIRSTSHSIFQCHVVVNGLDANGSGTSKEHASNLAALSLLDKLISTNFFGNVIGRLQEFCATISWPLPKYTEEMAGRTLIKNEYVFIVACSVKQYSEIGQGRSKRMAKIFAAYKMWYKLTGKN
ncbi:uncharacterized protein LOC119085997 [Bradysia coprophila]|uniref:uncharacterized protein LOC119085997 n=1 Tax=Bradysia coprophila TaxID=38358 RepID=UPI00187DBCA9|nr:uncharacterized protein LOC119085997 [Bradysia coprophila]